jgi:ribosomal protein S18 acetylase RimI-like enzyme
MNIIIRSIQEDDLDLMARVGGEANHPETLERYKFRALRSWKRGESFPEWYFLMLRDGEPVGRVTYVNALEICTFPEVMMVDLLIRPPYDAELELFRELLNQSLIKMRQYGATKLIETLSSGFVAWARNRTLAIIEMLNAKNTQIEHLYELGFVSHETANNLQGLTFLQGLTLRQFDGSDKELFCQLAQRVLLYNDIQSGDLYDRLRWRNQSLGLVGWSLYTSTSDLLGFILAGNPDHETGHIVYVAVVPEQRRKGYGSYLVAHAAKWYRENDFEGMLCAIDSEEQVMIGVLKNNHYKLISTTEYYEVDLTLPAFN